MLLSVTDLEAKASVKQLCRILYMFFRYAYILRSLLHTVFSEGRVAEYACLRGTRAVMQRRLNHISIESRTTTWSQLSMNTEERQVRNSGKGNGKRSTFVNVVIAQYHVSYVSHRRKFLAERVLQGSVSQSRYRTSAVGGILRRVWCERERKIQTAESVVASASVRLSEGGAGQFGRAGEFWVCSAEVAIGFGGTEHGALR